MAKLKVLMLTPMVDETHDILGFILSWIRKLGERVERLYVITPSYNMETPLPQNVTVYGLNSKKNKLSKFFYLNRVLLGCIPKVDVIFCHMYPNFTLISAPYAKLFRKPIVTWYVHGHVSRRLRIAHFLASRMVTSSKEGLRIKSNKIIITGHGIDTEKFKPVNRSAKKDKITILSVGRISPIKNYETLIKAADILVNEEKMKNLEFLIVGGVPMASHEEYFKRLKKMVRVLELEDYVKFVGPVLHTEIVEYYQGCDIHVNMCPMGGMDKAVLEAMACGKPVIVSNKAFKDLLKPYDGISLFKQLNSREMAEKLKNLINNKHLWIEISTHHREKIVKNHSTSNLIASLVNVFSEVAYDQR
jgi:glycosyltransferase involved in cell wall biosynthesis